MLQTISWFRNAAIRHSLKVRWGSFSCVNAQLRSTWLDGLSGKEKTKQKRAGTHGARWCQGASQPGDLERWRLMAAINTHYLRTSMSELEKTVDFVGWWVCRHNSRSLSSPSGRPPLSTTGWLLALGVGAELFCLRQVSLSHKWPLVCLEPILRTCLVCLEPGSLASSKSHWQGAWQCDK